MDEPNEDNVSFMRRKLVRISNIYGKAGTATAAPASKYFALFYAASQRLHRIWEIPPCSISTLVVIPISSVSLLSARAAKGSIDIHSTMQNTIVPK
jgi:hypothetical protein